MNSQKYKKSDENEKANSRLSTVYSTVEVRAREVNSDAERECDCECLRR